MSLVKEGVIQDPVEPSWLPGKAVAEITILQSEVEHCSYQ